MIKLKNVSKFYYTKGTIASGFSKVSLEFNMGEFVVITGESGSGKSTLLNVISGLDTYEEGEMYINGFETSHYTEKDFEDYRKKYIGNIFQNFNLINSYTVLQNVEIVLTLAGARKKEAKKRALELIEKVGLSKYKNTKASKLSGGQKQRVAIARALAKDTPIIIADEPTGNLDSESAREVFKILKEVSRDKLVIIVTHNYEQVESYATRKIKMHDGRVVEDYKITETSFSDDYNISEETNKMRFFSKVRIGFRNAFNIPAKFLLLTLVFFFVSVSLISEYSTMKEATYQEGITGWNWVFNNSSEKRIILKKMEDEKAVPFTDDDYSFIEGLDNVDYIEKQDLLVDQSVSLDSANYYIYGYCSSISNYKGDSNITCGVLPTGEKEIFAVCSEDNYYFYDDLEKYLNEEYQIYLMGEYKTGYKLTGIDYQTKEENPMLPNDGVLLYVSDDMLDTILLSTNTYYSKISMSFLGKTYYNDTGDNMWHIATSDNVAIGTCVMSDEHNYLVDKTYDARHKILTINVENPYYSDSVDLECVKTYSIKEMKNYYTIIEGDEYSWYYGYIFVNPSDYMKLFDKPSYQMSVFIKDGHLLDETLEALNSKGYDTLALRDTLYSGESAAILQLVSNIMTVIAAVILLFIAYFVIRIILKSRNVYYSTIRMLGASISISRSLLIVELMVDAIVSYILTLSLIYVGSYYAPNISLIKNVTQYMDIMSLVIVFLIVVLISIGISIRYSNRLFKKSTISTIREEV